MNAVPEAPVIEQEQRYPFWHYSDLALFLGLAVPGLFVCLLIVTGIARVLPFGMPNRAVLGLYAQFLAYGAWLASLWLIFRARYDAPLAKSLAWIVPRRGLSLSVLLGPALAISVALLGRILNTPQIDDPFRKLLHGPLAISVLGISVVLLGPLLEELVFRGFVLPLLMRDLGVISGILATAIPFALLHGPQYSWQWQYVVLILLVGSTLGIVRYRTGSTLASALLHILYNATIFTGYLAELTRQGSK